ncbi:hypothetical protein PanWU01x14_211550, partial [Parasponia andersonii]
TFQSIDHRSRIETKTIEMMIFTFKIKDDFLLRENSFQPVLSHTEQFQSQKSRHEMKKVMVMMMNLRKCRGSRGLDGCRGGKRLDSTTAPSNTPCKKCAHMV